jgi:hypothetical protein
MVKLFLILLSAATLFSPAFDNYHATPSFYEFMWILEYFSKKILCIKGNSQENKKSAYGFR